jgi:hypothetical protein
MWRKVRRKKPIETKTLTDHCWTRWSSRATSCNLARGVDKLNADNANALMSLGGEERRRSFQATCTQLSVRIKEQQKIGRRPSCALIAGGSEASIFAIADDFKRQLLAETPEGVEGAVGRAVIDNDNATKFDLIASNSRERLYAFYKMMPGVPIYNNRIKSSLAHFGGIDGHTQVYI